MVSASIIAILISCSSPQERAASEYSAALEPLLDENTLVADQVGALAAEVYRGQSAGKEARSVWVRDLVPLTEHLHHQAESVVVPSEWAEIHAGLVQIWGDRADAYRGLSEALDAGSPQGWTAASERAYTAKVMEERWFISTNEKLAPYGIALQQFLPRPAPSPDP